MAKQNSPIIWVPKKVNVKDIKPTPNNYKIKTDLGKERLATSLKAFGMAGTVVVNTDLCLIDGNSRLEEAKAKKEKTMWVSMPNRKLSPKEFTEMSAMFDFAKAGEVDMERIKKELGTHKDFYERYRMEVPLELLAGMGANAKIERDKKLQFPEDEEAVEVNDIKMVQLFFNTKQEAEFRKIEEVLKKKLKVDNTTDCVLKAFRQLKGK
jgi:DNA-binding cell septation regulator SpoVG